ncbi:MAG: flagellar motor switch phosphatase FliY, partial [Bacteroidia bacterium]|nr:flagellar motor switch phosphatase FliY [Bacteroidia bacterium]
MRSEETKNMSNLSQAEIDALLRGEPQDTNAAKNTGEIDISAYAGSKAGSSPDQRSEGDALETEGRTEDISRYFSLEEIDALGEIGNICMGTSATTMNMLLGRKVTITTPRVALYKTEDVLASYNCPFIAINVEFVEGLFGKNLLILKDYDAALITDLLMGGEGSVDKDNIVLTEIHLSAVSEVMNQMMGSAATAMANMMGDGINISPPQVSRMAVDESVGKYLDGATPVVKISFDMEIEGLLKSQLLQIMSIDMAKELITSLMHTEEPEEVKPVPQAARVVNAPSP